jgi:hypothetical protein
MFVAKFPGRCENGDRIEPGDNVEYRDELLVHVECTDRLPADKPSRFEGTTTEAMGY